MCVTVTTVYNMSAISVGKSLPHCVVTSPEATVMKVNINLVATPSVVQLLEQMAAQKCCENIRGSDFQRVK